MPTTTVPPGNDKPMFFLTFPTTGDFVPEKAYLSFSLPAGKAFPSDLSGLMEKTERFLSYEDSAIEGVEFQKCEGTNCACANCRQQLIVCEGRTCAGFVSSTDGIECNNTNCVPTNNTEYSMYPLYPDFMLAYSPKFKFIRYVRGGGTTTPSTIRPTGDHVFFRVSFPSSDVFDTTEKFRELQAAVEAFAPTFKQYEAHNTATLQRIIKKNKLNMDTMTRGGQKTKPPSSLQPTTVSKVSTTRTPGTIKPRAPATKRPTIVERYEDDLVLADLVVPDTENTDTDNTPVELLTPEPGFATTAPPTHKELPLTQILMIVGGSLAAFVILATIATILFARRSVAPTKSKVKK